MSEVNGNVKTELAKDELEHLSILRRRQEYLQMKLDQSRRNSASHDSREHRALTWAIGRLTGTAEGRREATRSDESRQEAMGNRR